MKINISMLTTMCATLLIINCVLAQAPLESLKANPLDRTELDKLYKSLTTTPNSDEKCRYGAIYALGVLSLGDFKEGMRIREQMGKAFPNNAYLQVLSDEMTHDACTFCKSIQCEKCNGAKKCKKCDGTGQIPRIDRSNGKLTQFSEITTEFGGTDPRREHLKRPSQTASPKTGTQVCPSCGGNKLCSGCKGTGSFTPMCNTCKGKGLIVSKSKCQSFYLQLLQSQGVFDLESFRKTNEQGVKDNATKLQTPPREKQSLKQNIEETMKNPEQYIKAAEQGDAEAQYCLGVTLLGSDKSSQKSEMEAFKLLSRAAEQGHAAAQAALGGAFYGNGVGGIAKNPSMAFKWSLKAAQQNNSSGQLYVGLSYMLGNGVAKDPELAVEWLRKAADQNEREAQLYLGACYADGTGIPKDDYEAVKWYRKAAEQGHALAQFVLSTFYYGGRGVRGDPDEAGKWCLKSAELGHKTAQYFVGLYYESGMCGLRKDKDEAMKWYRKAAAQGSLEAISRLRDSAQ